MSQREPSDRLAPVRGWLWFVAALVAGTIIVGGITRLTGSGLSITEWQPFSGVLPPLSETAWIVEFDRYKTIPQFSAVNPDMTLSGFKYIYWWEWTHRMLGRLIGVAFAVPFVVFLWRGLIDRALGWKLGGLFALGGLQGTVGWWMVSSGLSERIDVSQYRLAIHLTLACVILSAIVAVAVSLRPSPPERVSRSGRARAWLLLLLVFAQIFAGALVAKTGAGLTFNTWPLIDGRLLPSTEQLFAMQPVWRNFFENVLTVQFTHRVLAYALFALAAFHAFAAGHRGTSRSALRAAILFALVTVQAALGVVTLLWQAPLGLALAHQAGAVAVLIAVTLHLALLRPQAARP